MTVSVKLIFEDGGGDVKEESAVEKAA